MRHVRQNAPGEPPEPPYLFLREHHLKDREVAVVVDHGDQVAVRQLALVVVRPAQFRPVQTGPDRQIAVLTRSLNRSKLL
jgi:hypothetical protein